MICLGREEDEAAAEEEGEEGPAVVFPNCLLLFVRWAWEDDLSQDWDWND